MLYIIADSDQGRPCELGWHVQDKFTTDKIHLMNLMMKNVTQVQADGDELDLILSKAKNLPHTSERVQNWHGDHAKWIISNILYKVR